MVLQCSVSRLSCATAEKAEAKRRAAEEARLAAERAEAERIAREKAEAERIAGMQAYNNGEMSCSTK